MAPKVNCNPVKLTSIVSYFQKSRTAHSIKDLEKHLPSVASINGMQVKDYLQALADEDRINVEKIGSGNWYWSFPSQDAKVRQNALDHAQAVHDKQSAINNELRARIAEAAAQHEEQDQCMLDDAGRTREHLMAAKVDLEASLVVLSKGLAAYSEDDPTELESKRTETKRLAAEAEAYTDDIYAMESWFTKMGASDALASLRSELYGDELDKDSGILRDMV